MPQHGTTCAERKERLRPQAWVEGAGRLISPLFGTGRLPCICHACCAAHLGGGGEGEGGGGLGLRSRSSRRKVGSAAVL